MTTTIHTTIACSIILAATALFGASCVAATEPPPGQGEETVTAASQAALCAELPASCAFLSAHGLAAGTTCDGDPQRKSCADFCAAQSTAGAAGPCGNPDQDYYVCQLQHDASFQPNGTYRWSQLCTCK